MRIGIYLGRSPQHNKNVALVMNRTNGLVSPQFHVAFDTTFNTVKQDRHDSTWQVKAGFTQADTNTIKAQREPRAPTKVPINQREPNSSRKRKLQKEAPEISEKKIAMQSEQGTTKPTTKDIGQKRPQLQQQHQYNTQNATTRFGRKVRPVQRLINAMIAEIERDTQEDNVNQVQGEIFCHSAMYPIDDTVLDTTHYWPTRQHRTQIQCTCTKQ